MAERRTGDLDAHEAQVGARELGRSAVEAEEVHLDEPGEELDEGKRAWIASVIGPAGRDAISRIRRGAH
ncbi:MAG: hypothetical protein R3B72_51945 [Polyangiaceae bacterium]